MLFIRRLVTIYFCFHGSLLSSYTYRTSSQYDKKAFCSQSKMDIASQKRNLNENINIPNTDSIGTSVFRWISPSSSLLFCKIYQTFQTTNLVTYCLHFFFYCTLLLDIMITYLQLINSLRPEVMQGNKRMTISMTVVDSIPTRRYKIFI